MYSQIRIRLLRQAICLNIILSACSISSAGSIQVPLWTLAADTIQASFQEPVWHSEVAFYQAAITSTPTPPEQASPAWADVGVTTSFNLESLELVNGQDYHVHVQARLQDDSIQFVGTSQPIKAVQPVATIGEAKGFPDNTWLAVNQKKISKNASQFLFYIQEPDRSSGIMVYDSAGSLATSELLSGRLISIAGRLGRLNNTLCLYDPLIAVGILADAPIPVYVRNQQAGGSPFAYQPPPTEQGERGASWSSGLNNMSLLIRTSGRVMESVPGFRMRISDRSTLQPVVVWLPFGETSPQVGDFVEVVGHTDTTGIRLLSPTSWKKLN